jgi:hypothetical protein
VTSRVYDHTSILKLIERKWNLPAHQARRGGDRPLDALDLQNPPRFLTPPPLPQPARQRRG